jgi:integrase/recombinase XerD
MGKGLAQAQRMRRWADKKGGYAAAPDGFDRSDAGTLASRADAWLAWLEGRAYSPATLAARVWALRAFLGWAQERGLLRPEMITRPVLESYQRWLWRREKADGRPLGVRTQRSFLAALQGLFAWLCRQNLLPGNPAADLELPRKPRRSLPKALALAEVAAVLAVPDVSDPLGVRDRAMLEILYATGLRRTELVRLDLSDVDRAHGTLWVRQGKGGKDRVVPIGEVALHWIEKYLSACRPRLESNGGRDPALFLTGYGERFHPGYVGNWVKRAMKAAGIERLGSCHLLRHSCATHMLENGADIRFIQQLLGHARLDTTQIYTEVTIHQLREVHARTHPHGRRAETTAGSAAATPAAATAQTQSSL